jgi:hypothetical protein
LALLERRGSAVCNHEITRYMCVRVLNVGSASFCYLFFSLSARQCGLKSRDYTVYMCPRATVYMCSQKIDSASFFLLLFFSLIGEAYIYIYIYIFIYSAVCKVYMCSRTAVCMRSQCR